MRVIVVAGLIIVLLAGCATPNEPDLPDEENILSYQILHETNGFAMDFWLTEDRIYIAEDQAGFSIISKTGEVLLHSNEDIENARLIVPIEDENTLFVYDRYGSPADIRAYDITQLDSLQIKPPITGQTSGIEMIHIEPGSLVQLYWSHDDLIQTGSYDNGWVPGQNYSFPNTIVKFAKSDNIFYVTGEQIGVYVFDIVAGEIIDTIDTPGEARDVKYVDNTLFVACQEEGIEIVDVTETMNPVTKFQQDTSGYAQSVAIENNILAVGSGGGGVYVYDISDLDNVFLLGRIDDQEIGYTYKVEIQNEIVYASTKKGIITIQIEN